MSHQSENCKPLNINNVSISQYQELNKIDSSNPAVFLFVLPFDSSQHKVKFDYIFFIKQL